MIEFGNEMNATRNNVMIRTVLFKTIGVHELSRLTKALRAELVIPRKARIKIITVRLYFNTILCMNQTVICKTLSGCARSI